MEDLPHLYSVTSEASVTGNVTTRAENLPDLAVAPPRQFGGPGDEWSPEDLFMASISNCLILSFRAIARASKLEWDSIECESEGELDRVDRKIKFTTVRSKLRLVIPAAESKEKAEKVLSKAEGACLISNSLSCESQVEGEIVISGE